MLSSTEFYKKLLIITALVIGGVLVFVVGSAKAADTYQCVCTYGNSQDITADNEYTAQSSCSTFCSIYGGVGSLRKYTGGGCYPPCNTFTEDCQQDAETGEYNCVPKSAAGCPGGCSPGEECKWDDTDKSWSCEPVSGQSCPTGYQWNPNAETEEGVPGACEPVSGTTQTVDCGGTPCNGTCTTDDYGQPLCVPTAGGGTGGVGTGGSTGGLGTGGSKYELPNPLGVTSISALITKIAKFLIALAIPFAVFMVILAGFRFATAQGNEEKLTKAKQNFIWTIAGVAIILASEALIIYIEELLGAGGGGTVNAFINKIRQTLNSVIVILFILVTIYFGWGVIQYVVGSRGDEEKLTQGKRHMIWGIVGMTVMASAWGIVSIISAYLR